ncbi:hypothetical protein [Sphingosinithalassobacter sp. LHW66-3]|uniref:hypothetical protein n=1 Tax=Sphingosinithalassobacter sp. LHW66-3 TaxID=3424718 RepID=UPI003D6B8598
MIRFASIGGAALALLASPAAAQHVGRDGHEGHEMPAPPTAAARESHADPAVPNAPLPLAATYGSGTARLPSAEGGMHGLHLATGDWMVMAHGYVWGAYTDQSGPRGDEMAFVGSMAMLTAGREFAGGARFEARTMLSLEPLMGAPGYPNVFATGETANGEALVDRQHPHDLFMELAARVDVPLGGDVSGFLYGGPVAEPALGPSAFMHRGSARYMPLAPITHHWFDSTHITYGVVTAGIATPRFQIEGSAFRGREPDEARWDVETPKLDSWSLRASWTPTPNWALQVSHGRLESPEELHPGQDEARTTASVHYSAGGIATTLAFSAKNRVPGDTLTAWLAEANWNLDGRNNLFGRIESVANDELFPDHHHSLHDRQFRVARFEAGYAHRLPLTGPLSLALGGSLAAFDRPEALRSAYGDPFGYTLFARLSLGD